MFSLSQIKNYFPPYVGNEEFMLKEYLQYKILKLIFGSIYGRKLSFLWGTALRIGYGNTRFSEDLDFDNFWVTFEEFASLGELVQKWLQLEGLDVEIRTLQKWAFHCSIKIPRLLYENNLAPMPSQRILIQIDTVSQWYTYTPQHLQITKFDTQTWIRICSPQLMLAQKIYTVFERKKIKGRDFHDIVFLTWLTKQPDRWFITLKLWISTPALLKTYVLKNCAGINFEDLQKDVNPFLFQPSEAVKFFPERIKQIEFV